MSCLYELCIVVYDHNRVKEPIIRATLENEWYFDSFGVLESDGHWQLRADGEDYSEGDETAEELARRIAKLVWEANGAYCHVRVVTTNSFEFDEKDYVRN